jgi:hypothetical protein
MAPSITTPSITTPRTEAPAKALAIVAKFDRNFFRGLGFYKGKGKKGFP